jgi:hypothetical protein
MARGPISALTQNELVFEMQGILTRYRDFCLGEAKPSKPWRARARRNLP